MKATNKDNYVITSNPGAYKKCYCGRRMTDATWCHSLSIIPNKMGNLVRN